MHSRTVLSWNVGLGVRFGKKKKIEPPTLSNRSSTLAAIVESRRPSILALQESPPEFGRNELQNYGYDYVVHPGRHLLLAYRIDDWVANPDSLRTPTNHALSIQLTDPGSGHRLTTYNVHLLSRLRGKEKTWGSMKSLLDVLEEEGRPCTSDGFHSEIWAGDFNMDPFEEPIESPEYMHGHRCSHLAQHPLATWAKRRPLYNCAWTVTRPGGPRGTIFYSESHKEKGDWPQPWRVFDQIMMTPDLAGPDSTLEILDSAGSTKLAKTQPPHTPESSQGSDHFPVCTSIEWR